MNLFEKILVFLQGKMIEPIQFGIYHISWVIVSILLVIILYKFRREYNKKQCNIILYTYGIIALILELLKQLIWTFEYKDNILIYDYQWYAFPFQFCTTPIFVSLLIPLIKNNKIRDSLISYLSYFTILGSIMTMILPDSCLTNYILVNVHTMWLHCGSFVISCYLLINNKFNFKKFINGFYVFVIFVLLANTLNIVFYSTNIIGNETFNMFYISPYFISELPIYNIIQQNVPYIVYLLFYILTIFIGGLIVYNITCFIKRVID